MTACPYCGCGFYYRRVRFSGTGTFHHRFDGEAGDNTHLHEDVTYTEQKTMYCEDCHKPLGSAPEKKG